MEMHELNSPIRYIYCLVDKENNRFKLGSTLHMHYAPALVGAYCPFDSFQAGFVEEYALIGERVLREQHAAEILTGPGNERTEDGVWMHISAFDVVRATLCAAQHVVPPTVLLLIQAETEKAQICAELDKLLGL